MPQRLLGEAVVAPGWGIFSRLARRCAFRLIVVSRTLIKTPDFLFFSPSLCLFKPQHLVMSLRESGLAALFGFLASAAKKRYLSPVGGWGWSLLS